MQICIIGTFQHPFGDLGQALLVFKILDKVLGGLESVQQHEQIETGLYRARFYIQSFKGMNPDADNTRIVTQELYLWRNNDWQKRLAIERLIPVLPESVLQRVLSYWGA